MDVDKETLNDMAELAEVVYDFLSPIFMEFVMFGLAALVYHMFASRLPKSKAPKFKVKPVMADEASEPQPSCEQGPDSPAPPKAAGKKCAEPPSIAEMLASVMKAGSQASQELGAQVLASLCKPGVEKQVGPSQLMALEGKISAKSLQAVASRVRGSLAARKLVNVATLASIPVTEEAIVSLVKAHKGEAEAMKIFLEEFVLSGFVASPSEVFFKRTAAACTAAGEADLARFVQDQKPKMQHDLSAEAKAISALGRGGDLGKAEAHFRRLRDDGAVLNSHIYNCMLEACVECNDLQSAMKYLTEMRMNKLADVVSYNTLMKGFGAKGDMAQVKRMFSQMAERGVAPSTATFHCLMEAAVQCGDVQSMWETFSQMCSRLQPDTVTCTILLKSVQDVEGLDHVMEIFDASGHAMDSKMLIALSDACIRAKSYDALWERLVALVQDTGTDELTPAAFASLLKACSHASDADRAILIWNQMLSCGQRPSQLALMCTIDGLVRAERPEEAWQLIQPIWEDADTRHLINTVVYSNILKGFAQAMQHERLTGIFAEMRERGIQANVVTFNTMLNGLVRCSMTKLVPQILAEMRQCGLAPDIVTYSTLIQGHCKSGEVAEGLKLMREMVQTSSLKPDGIMFNSLLSGCARQNLLPQALEILEEMHKAGISQSNYSLGSMVRLLGQAQRLDDAMRMVETVSKETDVQPNLHVYTCLVQACLSCKQIHKALELHDRMIDHGCMPDQRFYSTLVMGCIFQGGLTGTGMAMQVVRAAYDLPDHGFKRASAARPGVDPSCLQQVLRKLGSSAQACAFRSELVATGVTTR